MTAIRYGDQYDQTLTTKDVAARIRQQLRADCRATTGPLAGWAVSVRYRGFAGGTAIDITLHPPAGVHVRHQWADTSHAGEHDPTNRCVICDEQLLKVRSESGGLRRWWYTPAGRAAWDHATRLHDAYNYDGSDTQTDYFHVNYYGTVTLAAQPVQ